MGQQHLRVLHEINREYPDLGSQAFYREYHSQRLDDITADGDEPRLLLHIFPEHLQDGERLIDVEELEQLLVPGVCRGQFDRDVLLRYPETFWDRVTATFENHRGLSSNATLYDTGLYETLGTALCYPLDSHYNVEYATSSQDLEQGLVGALQFHRELLPDDYSQTVYVVLSGVKMDKTTMDQYREVQRIEAFNDAEVTSRLTSVDLYEDIHSLRDQLASVLRPFWHSQTRLDPDLYYTDEDQWEFADDMG